MKRILLWIGAGTAVAAAVLILLFCTFVFGNHRFREATCTEPETCARCGLTRGEPLGHEGTGATCEAPSVCSRCGERLGDPLGHDFDPATCETPETCSRCGAKRGDPRGHSFLPASCTEPETCADCGEKRGDPLGHVMTEPNYQEPASCTRCGWIGGEPLPAALGNREMNELKIGEPAPYTTASYEDFDVEISGTVEIAEYCVIEGDESFPPRAGYEWHIATVRLVFSGDDARSGGAKSAWTFGDRYLGNVVLTAADGEGMRAFAVDWYGTKVKCWQKTEPASEADWFDRELRFTWREGVLVPKGYDGVLLLFYPYCGTDLSAFDALEQDALVFRMH